MGVATVTIGGSAFGGGSFAPQPTRTVTARDSDSTGPGSLSFGIGKLKWDRLFMGGSPEARSQTRHRYPAGTDIAGQVPDDKVPIINYLRREPDAIRKTTTLTLRFAQPR